MKILGNHGQEFTIMRQLIASDEFNLHECELNGKTFFLKVATTRTQNNTLEREQYVLELLKDEASELEKEFVKSDYYSGNPLNNHFVFPRLVDTFFHEERKVLILSFEYIANQTSDLTPLSFITQRDQVHVDPRTSAWILGKLLKMLVFTHATNVSLGDLSGDNILINKKNHYIALCHWHNAVPTNDLSDKEKSEEIIAITTEVINLLGGNSETGEIPADEQVVDNQYPDLLKKLLSGHYVDAKSAHTDFYKIIRLIWSSKFHPYTTKKF